jgi:hypothetical protein
MKLFVDVYLALHSLHCFVSDRLTKEVEFLQGAFESYKSQLHIEMHDKWKVKEEDLRRELEEAKEAAVHELSKLLHSHACYMPSHHISRTKYYSKTFE